MKTSSLGGKAKILKRAAYVAFPHSLPILFGYGFLGLTYGILMSVNSFSPFFTAIMSLIIFGGSSQFVAVTLLTTAFDPLNTFIITAMICARHIFYGLSMLEKYKGLGLKKIYMIFGMVDETFSINYSAEPPSDVDRGWFMFFVTAYNHMYWVIGSVVGAISGSMIKFSTEGIDFVMTAMFVVIFINQWQNEKCHLSAVSGLILSALSLVIFGPDNFIIPAMIAIFISLTLSRSYLENKVGENNDV